MNRPDFVGILETLGPKGKVEDSDYIQIGFRRGRRNWGSDSAIARTIAYLYRDNWKNEISYEVPNKSILKKAEYPKYSDEVLRRFTTKERKLFEKLVLEQLKYLKSVNFKVGSL